MGIVERVNQLVEPICADLGVELFDVDHAGGILRVTVEREGGVDIGTISLITRELSRALDHDDPIPGRYTLEVSSPGLERPLRRQSHFVRSVGQRIKVKTKPHVEGERRLEGTLAAADDDGIQLVIDDGTTRSLAYDDIEKANTIFEWGPAPKPGKKPGKASATKKAVNA
ncbi:MAG TPA: ribosome maturation factor RimP [Acidimicrobiales bacterium]|nr:ribosome maturation factor RimP [Acidimicrobiales bacterium]